MALRSEAQARLVVMHGYADYTSALVWVQAEAPGRNSAFAGAPSTTDATSS